MRTKHDAPQKRQAANTIAVIRRYTLVVLERIARSEKDVARGRLLTQAEAGKHFAGRIFSKLIDRRGATMRYLPVLAITPLSQAKR